MVDLSATGNFILPSLTNKKKFFIWVKEDIYTLIVIDKVLLPSQNKRIDEEIELLLVTT